MHIDLKIILRIGVFAVAAIVAALLIASTPVSTPAEAVNKISRDLVLFICSTVVSWTISAWFARKESNDKIDAIAERSFEKMAMLTLQIERAKKFLVDTIKLSQSETDGKLGMSAYKHRINGSISTLDQISASNDTFRADWLGVVSEKMKIDLKTKLEALSNVQEIVNDLSKGQEKDAIGDAEFDKKIQTAEREVAGAGRLIGELKVAKLPKPPVADVSQQPEGEQSPTVQQGLLTIDVRRLTFRATGTGAFIPHMSALPWVTITAEQWPELARPEQFRFPVGVGTNFNFNVMLSSTTYGESLPLGRYVFRYRASCAEAVEAGTVKS